MASPRRCISCGGSGELPTDYGIRECPDCGGAGELPSRATLTEWRTRDFSRVLEKQDTTLSRQDALWLIAELRRTRTALTEIIALAHDIKDEEQIALRIRMAASDAIGLYEQAPLEAKKAHS